MVQSSTESRTSPTLMSLSGWTANSPTPSHNKVNTVKVDRRDRGPDVITAVWEVAPTCLARTIDFVITARDMSKTARLLLPTHCPHLKVTLETDSFDQFLKISVDQPQVTGNKQKFRVVASAPSQDEKRRVIVLRLLELEE